MIDMPGNPLACFLAIGGLMARYGAVVLLLTWCAPRMLERRLFHPRMLGRFPRTRTNLTVVSCWSLAWGVFVPMSALKAGLSATLWPGLLAVALVIPAARAMRHKPPVAPATLSEQQTPRVHARRRH